MAAATIAIVCVCIVVVIAALVLYKGVFVVHQAEGKFASQPLVRRAASRTLLTLAPAAQGSLSSALGVTIAS